MPMPRGTAGKRRALRSFVYTAASMSGNRQLAGRMPPARLCVWEPLPGLEPELAEASLPRGWADQESTALSPAGSSQQHPSVSEGGAQDAAAAGHSPEPCYIILESVPRAFTLKLSNSIKMKYWEVHR